MALLDEIITHFPDLSSEGIETFTEVTNSSDKSRYLPFFVKIADALRVKKKTINSSQVLQLQLVLSELYANAVIHGNQAGTEEDYERRKQPVPDHVEENRKKPILLEAVVGTNYVVVAVQDEGSGFDVQAAIEKSKGIDGRKETGRGLALIANYATQYYYTKGKIVVLKTF